jgi:prephenate dehydrogenase
MYKNILFIGAGIIGGSYIKQIRKHYPEIQLEVVESDIHTAEALKKDSIKVYNAIENCKKSYDILWFCLPESITMEVLTRVNPKLYHEKALIVDCCSSKGMIKAWVLKLGLKKYHKSIHPIFGSEKRGYLYSDASKVLDSTCIICDDDRKDSFYDFLGSLGHQIVCLSIEDHDRYYALTSHLTHVFALLQNSMIEERNEAIIPPSFKTLKRLSDIDPVLWTEILWHNKEALIQVIEKTQDNLEAVRLSLLGNSKDVFETLSAFKTLGGLDNESK